MWDRQEMSIGSLELDLYNYRHGPQPNQKAALEAIMADQKNKLVKLAKDIIQLGTSPFEQPIVVATKEKDGNFTVVEGNRRLATLKLLLDPDSAKGTPIHAAFVKLNKNHADAIPKVLECAIAPDRPSAQIWIERKHSSGMGGVGIESWSNIAKARSDAEKGLPRPDLDAVNFVLSDPKLDSEIRAHLSGSDFQLSTLERLVTNKELQDAADFKLKNGQLIASSNKAWLRKVLTDIVSTIKSGSRKGVNFTVRDIDKTDDRRKFVKKVVADHPGKKKASKRWTVTAKPAAVGTAAGAGKKLPRSTPSTAERTRIMRRDFKLKLPSGKINDIFSELKLLHAYKNRHSVSVLLRVFLEITIDEYMEKHGITLRTSSGRFRSLKDRLTTTLKHVDNTKLMTRNQLQPIRTAISDKGSVLAPETLNAYVHGKWMNPDPELLKITWNNVELFIERLWTSKPAKPTK